jgi:hypothetical protein
MKLNRILPLLAVSLTLTAAGVALAKSPMSIGVPAAAWKTPVLHTCWQTDWRKTRSDVSQWTEKNIRADAPSPQFIKMYQGWVNAAYNVGRVGIGFDGFVDCPTDPAALAAYPVYLVADMKLFKGLVSLFTQGGTAGLSVIGNPNLYLTERTTGGFGIFGFRVTNPNGQKIPYKAAVGYDFGATNEQTIEMFSRFAGGLEIAMGLDPQSQNPNDVQKTITDATRKELGLQVVDSAHFASLHELGHLAGLLHEDRRRDSAGLRPKFCLNVARDNNRENDKSFPLPESRMGTAYDPFSIMSYCRDTMQTLFREARLTCKLAPTLDNKTKESISNFLKDCDDVAKMDFPVDLTPRDVTALRLMYLKEAPGTGTAIDFRASARELRLYEIIDDAAHLPFDPAMVNAFNPPATTPNKNPSR